MFLFIIKHEVLMFKPFGIIAATIGICEAEGAGSEGSCFHARVTTIIENVLAVNNYMFITYAEKPISINDL